MPLNKETGTEFKPIKLYLKSDFVLTQGTDVSCFLPIAI